jgi:CheY-like chemotaxis protein
LASRNGLHQGRLDRVTTLHADEAVNWNERRAHFDIWHVTHSIEYASAVDNVPDVIIHNVEMPRMDGITFVRKHQSWHRGTTKSGANVQHRLAKASRPYGGTR